MDPTPLKIIQKDRLPLFIDGKEYHITARDLSKSHILADFIHDHIGRAARKACGEGGCGACVVIVTRPVVNDASDRTLRFESYSVTSCVTPIGELAFASVTTPQGQPAATASGSTPAQEALQTTNAAQCGFCTGGIVSVLDSSCAGRGLSVNDVEALLDGNLCRCTGYRSISEAAQMLCDDYRGIHQAEAKAIRDRARQYRARMDDPSSFPPSLRAAYEEFFCTDGVDGVELVESKIENSASADIPSTAKILYSHTRPASLRALTEIYAEAPDKVRVVAASGSARWENRRVLAAGFTDLAYEEHEAQQLFRHTVSVQDVPELHGWRMCDDGSLEIGAATPISALKHLGASLKEQGMPRELHERALDALATQSRYFANESVRHTATIGGGLVSCHQLSDMVPVWVALDARVDLVSRSQGPRAVPVRDLIDIECARLMLLPDEIVVALILPPRDPQAFVAEVFKQAIRRTDSMALVSAAMSAELGPNRALRNPCLAFGGLGAPGLRAKRTEAALDGFRLDADGAHAAGLEELLQTLKSEIEAINVRELPADMRDYQREVASGFLTRFVHMAAPGSKDFERSGRLQQPPCRGRQAFAEETVSGAIVGRAMTHRYLRSHVHGDTRYTIDRQLPEDGLHAAIVPAPAARGRLVDIDAEPCSSDRDFVKLITAADVPGSNMQGHLVHPLAEEEILCSGRVSYFGQPVALAVARTSAAANAAASRTRVTVEAEREPPILTFDDIEARDSWFSFEHHPDDPSREPRERRLTRGDPEAAFTAARADPERFRVFEGSVEVGGQSCFYLEPQCAVAFPWSDGGVRITSSTQSPAHVARYVASALGVAEHKVDVEAGLVGGGFGGKQTRSASFAAMAALAARATDRPVKLELSREADMTLVPGRSPFRADYRIALESNTGAITALDIDMISNGGAAEDYSPSITETAVFLIDNAYFIENAAIRARCGRETGP